MEWTKKTIEHPDGSKTTFETEPSGDNSGCGPILAMAFLAIGGLFMAIEFIKAALNGNPAALISIAMFTAFIFILVALLKAPFK